MKIDAFDGMHTVNMLIKTEPMNACAMREIFLYDSEEQWNLLDLDFDLERDADWDWVDSYVQSEAW